MDVDPTTSSKSVSPITSASLNPPSNTAASCSSTAASDQITTSPTVIIVLGMAGSGKTSFVQVF